MNENEYLARSICDQLEGGEPLVLASIIGLQGSGPRHSGTKMAVGADGKSYGTVGGSLLEAEAVRESRNVLAAARSRIMNYALDGPGAPDAGMICGGDADLLLDYIAATPENRAFFRQWREAIEAGRDFYSLTHLEGEGEDIRVSGHAILYSDGRIIESHPDAGTNVGYLKAELHNVSATSVIAVGERREVVDPIRRLSTLYCFGAGHVALPTAHIAALTGFRVVVVDDRPEFASAERFPEAYQVRVVDDFDRAMEGLEIDEDSFIVIVTRGHQYDKTVLEQALKTPAGYIGMVSSRRKRESLYAALTEGGASREALERVHSPIGIGIGGETPEEIAVSIVAELISERSKRQA